MIDGDMTIDVRKIININTLTVSRVVFLLVLLILLTGIFPQNGFSQVQTEREDFLDNALIPYWTDQLFTNIGRPVGLDLYKNFHGSTPYRNAIIWDGAFDRDLYSASFGYNKYNASMYSYGITLSHLNYLLSKKSLQRTQFSISLSKKLFNWNNLSKKSNQIASVHLGFRPEFVRFSYGHARNYFRLDMAILLDLAKRGVISMDQRSFSVMKPGESIPIKESAFTINGGLYLDDLFSQSNAGADIGLFITAGLADKNLITGKLSSKILGLGYAYSSGWKYLQSVQLNFIADFQQEKNYIVLNLGIQQNIQDRWKIYQTISTGLHAIPYRVSGVYSFGHRKPPELETGIEKTRSITVYLNSLYKSYGFPLSMDIKTPLVFIPGSVLFGQVDIHGKTLKQNESVFIEITGPDRKGVLVRARPHLELKYVYTFQDTVISRKLNILNKGNYLPGQWRIDVYWGVTPELSVLLGRSYFNVQMPNLDICLNSASRLEKVRQLIEIGQDKTHVITQTDLDNELALYQYAVELGSGSYNSHFQLARFLWWEIVSQHRYLDLKQEACDHIQIAKKLARSDAEQKECDSLIKLINCD